MPRQQVSYLDLSRGEQTGASWVNIVGAGKFRRHAFSVLQVRQPDRKRQMNQLLDPRCLNDGIVSCSRGGKFSAQKGPDTSFCCQHSYMSRWTMYGGNQSHGHCAELLDCGDADTIVACGESRGFSVDFAACGQVCRQGKMREAVSLPDVHDGKACA